MARAMLVGAYLGGLGGSLAGLKILACAGLGGSLLGYCTGGRSQGKWVGKGGGVWMSGR